MEQLKFSQITGHSDSNAIIRRFFFVPVLTISNMPCTNIFAYHSHTAAEVQSTYVVVVGWFVRFPFSSFCDCIRSNKLIIRFCNIPMVLYHGRTTHYTAAPTTALYYTRI